MILQLNRFVQNSARASSDLDNPSTDSNDLLAYAQFQQRRGNAGDALTIYSQLAQEVPGRVQEQINAIQGTGGFTAARAEYIVNRTMEGLFDLAPLGAMMGAGLTYRVARFGLLGSAARMGLTSPLVRPAASLLAFGAEATLFPVYGRMGNRVLGRQVDWSSQVLAHDIQSSFFVLGGLKFFGMAGNHGLRLWQQNAMLRGGLPQRILPTLVPQTAMYLGILSGHRAEQWTGLAPETSTGQLMAESFVTLAHFNAAARLIPLLGGFRTQQFERSLDRESGRMGERWLDQVRTGILQLTQGPEMVRASSREPGQRSEVRGPRSEVRPTPIMMMENDGEASGRGRVPNVTPVETPWGLGSGELPQPRPSSSMQTGLHEARKSLINYSAGDLIKILIQFRGQLGPAALTGLGVGQRDLVERFEVLQTLALPNRSGALFNETLAFIGEHRGGESISQMNLPDRPRQLLLSGGIEQISQLTDYIRSNRLQDIPGLGPRRENKIIWALIEFSGLREAASRMREIQELMSQDATSTGKREVQRFKNQIRNTLLRGITNDKDSAVLSFTFKYNKSENQIQIFEGDYTLNRSGFFSVQAHYHENRIQMTSQTFHELDGLVNHPASQPLERRFASALMDLADQPIILALKDSHSIIPIPKPRNSDYPPASEPTVGSKIEISGLPSITRQFGKYSIEVDVEKGFQSVSRALDQMDPRDLQRLEEIARSRPDQPWFVAGISDGMGFQSTAALIASGMMRHGVGVFYEPPALLEFGSPIHLGRLANVEGLRLLADQHGVNFAIHYEDMILPRWNHPEGTRPFPANVMESIDRIRGEAEIPDLNFINSIAFARWISPSMGVERRMNIPSVDLEGRVILMNMKPYAEKGYEGTLDSMGRNHFELLQDLAERFGPQSTSFFYTWAGGSQNWRVLHGIYGGGALGHAKELGETAAVNFHIWSMANEMAYGSHRVVRYPDFLSFALFGIPGGGGFGLIARNVLERQGMYLGVPQLAPRTFIEAFGGTHNRRNPIAQIEFDAPETTFMPRIQRNLESFYERVELYRKENPQWDGKPLDLETSRRLLRGLVAEDYVDQIPNPTE